MNVSPDDARAALPGPLPEGERVLWAARPPFGGLLRHLFRGRWLAAIVLVLAAWPVIAALDAGYPLARALPAAALLLPMALPAAVLVWLFARLVASHTLYVATDRRVIVHAGYVFTRTLNLPLAEIRELALRPLPGGLGDIQLSIAPDAAVSYPALFPHARLARIFAPVPLLRCVPQAEEAAERLADAMMHVRPGLRDTLAPNAAPVPA